MKLTADPSYEIGAEQGGVSSGSPRRVDRLSRGLEVYGQEAKASFTLIGLNAEQIAILRGALARSHEGSETVIVSLELASVPGKDGRYSLNEATVGRVFSASSEVPEHGSEVLEDAIAIGEFFEKIDGDEEALYFRPLQHCSGPEIDGEVRVLPPEGEIAALIGRLPVDGYGIEVKLAQGLDLDGHASVVVEGLSADIWRHPSEPQGFNPRTLLNRLQDRHFAGGSHYSAENLATGVIDPDDPATVLNPVKRKEYGDDPLTVGDVRNAIEHMQRKHANGNIQLVAEEFFAFDQAPGFSWVEPEEIEGRLAPAVRGIVARYGEDILSDRAARDGENGLSNTLKLIDIVTRDPRSFPEARGDLTALKAGGLIFKIQAASDSDEMGSERLDERQDQRSSIQ